MPVLGGRNFLTALRKQPGLGNVRVMIISLCDDTAETAKQRGRSSVQARGQAVQPLTLLRFDRPFRKVRIKICQCPFHISSGETDTLRQRFIRTAITSRQQ
jgi:hypothetical protein